MEESTGSSSFSPSSSSSFASHASNEPSRENEEKKETFGMRMMKMQGWKEGEGLGKEKSGNVDIIETNLKLDRAGLGQEREDFGFAQKKHEVDTSRFVPHAQKVDHLWIHSPQETKFDFTMVLKKKSDSIDYSQFCEEKMIQEVFRLKTRLDPVPEKIFVDARNRANPYERIGKHFFMNRAAMKMANLDALFHVIPDIQSNGNVFQFADICAGPGGFSQYILWRRGPQKAKGWGFTLQGNLDWQFHKFGPVLTSHNFKACYGEDGTGNILLSKNIRHFANVVMKDTNDEGVDFVVGDGGTSVEGQENIQETLLKQLVMCQFLTTLSILKKHGNFICKVFDLFTPFTAGLIYILYGCFEKICIVKPYTSRPANSERYVVCKNLRERPQDVIEHLFKINDKLNELSSGDDDVSEIVDIPDTNFREYIRKSNLEILQQQLDSFELLFKCIEDRELEPLEQHGIRDRCIKEWNLPERDNSLRNFRRNNFRQNQYSRPHHYGRRSHPYSRENRKQRFSHNY